jgi:hypothetical protein
MQTQSPYPPPQAYPPPPEKKSSKVWLYVLIGVVALCLICGAVGAVVTIVGGNFFKNNASQITEQIQEQVKTVGPAGEVLETAMAQLTEMPGNSTTESTPEPGNTSEEPNPSGYIDQVILATGVEGDNMDPTGETMTFSPSDTFHAVVVTKDAPADTTFEAVWFAVDVGDAADPNTKIDQTNLTTEGTRNLDFSLKPTSKWPAGSYKVEISVNGTLDQVVEFTVE